MSIVRKVRAIERLYGHLDAEISAFRAETGVHCVSGCGKCCNKPDIEASPLEFLPLAFHWFITHQADEKMAHLESNTSPLCVIYSPLTLLDLNKGNCSIYQYRGLICRLFGYAARRDKYGDYKMVTCKIIKEMQAENYQQAVAMLERKEYVPVFTEYYQKLMQIDFRMASQMMPINEAIREALETVLSYYAYRPFPRLKKAA